MKNKKKSFELPYQVLALLLIALFYVLFGFYYETFDDALFELYFKGFNHVSFITDEHLYHRLLVYFYTLFYKVMPLVNWYGWSLLLMQFMAVVNIFYLLGDSLKKYLKYKYVLIVLSCVFVVFIWRHFYLINFTRTAFLLMGSSFLLWIQKEGQPIRSKISFKMWVLIAFALSVLTRPATLIMVMVLLLPFSFLLFKIKNKSFKVWAKNITPFVLIVLGFTFYQQITLNKDMALVSRKMDLISNYIDYGNHSEVKLSAKEQLKVDLIRNWIFIDKSALDLNFLEKITSKNNLLSALSPHKLNYYLYDLKLKLWDLGLVYLLLNMALLTWLFWGVYQRHVKWYWLLVPFVCFIGFGSMIVLAAVYFKMPDRVLEPMLLLFSLGHFLFLMAFKPNWIRVDQTKQKILVGISCAVLILFAGLPSHVKKVRRLKKQLLNNSISIQEINKLKDLTLVFDYKAMDLIAGADVLKGVGLDFKHKLLSFVDVASVIPANYRLMQGLYGTSEFSKIFKQMIVGNQTLFITNQSFNLLLMEYFYKLYDQKFKFSIVSHATNLKNQKDQLNYYLLEEIKDDENDYFLDVLKKRKQFSLIADKFSVEGQIQIGKHFLQMKNLKRAKEHFEWAVAIDPDLGQGYFYLAKVFELNKELDRAKEYYLKCIRHDPAYLEAYNNLGIIYFGQNNLQEALNYFLKMAEVDKNSAKARYNLGQVYYKLGFANQAINSIKKALEIDPNYKKAKNALTQLLGMQKSVGDKNE
ncbi:hypothetical protein BVY03_00305 [bacterium K02(2017)]|nr:hypothetical protein BVY03_00305 [bacterium K02(2017)]